MLLEDCLDRTVLAVDAPSGWMVAIEIPQRSIGSVFALVLIPLSPGLQAQTSREPAPVPVAPLIHAVLTPPVAGASDSQKA